MRTTLLTFACVAGLVVALGRAEQTQGQGAAQAPVFRAAVDLIQVDVSVLDRGKRPVRGLTAADLTLLENGRPQAIVAFAEVDVPGHPPAAASWLRLTPPDVRTNALGDGRLFAIVLDDATIPFDLRMAANSRKIARDVIERLGPADLAAVIFVMDTRRSVDFTGDRARLIAAIDGFMPAAAFSDPVGGTDTHRYFASIRTLGQVSSHLATVPQRRKAVIYISTGVPVDPSAAASATSIGPAPGAPALDTMAEGSTVEDSGLKDLNAEMVEILTERPQEAYGVAMQNAFIRAQHGNVNIYSIDPAGLGGLQAYLQNHVRQNSIAGPTMTPIDAMQQARLHRDFLETVATNSGGRAILNTNNLAAGLEQIFAENSAYYLVGYQSTRDPNDRSVRRVTVRANRPGLTAQTRNAYFNPRAAPRTTPGPGSPNLSSALSGILPSPEIALRAAAVPVPRPEGGAALAITVGIGQTTRGDAGARVQEQLDLLVTAFDRDGRPRGSSRQTATLVLRAGIAEPVSYEVLSRIDLPPGPYQIRLAAFSAMTGYTGSVYADVDLPDFTRSGIHLSGVMLSAAEGPVIAPPDALATLVPVLPTSRRQFAATDRVEGFVRLAQGGSAAPGDVTLGVRLTDATDTVVIRSTEPVAAARFTGRTADVRFTVPLAQLAPGEYLLTVEAAQDGRTTRRDVRVQVR